MAANTKVEWDAANKAASDFKLYALLPAVRD